MKDPTLAYKLIAIAAVGWSMYSCSGSVESQGTLLGGNQFAQLTDAISALNDRLDTVDTKLNDLKGCSTADFVAGTCTGLPQEASLSTTYCIDQGRGAELAAAMKAELKTEVKLGAGWPNVAWGEAVDKITVPAGIGLLPLPSEAGGEVSTHLGKGLQICVQVPIEPDADQLALIGDLVRGVNVDKSQGLPAKYRRRADRLLNYAARRTPIAAANALANVQSKQSQGYVRAFAAEESNDAFDLADDAVERLLEGGLQPQTRIGGILSDPVFADLAASLDLPQQVTSIIGNPQQVFNRLQALSPANACANLGIDSNLRSTYPALGTLCNTLAALPADSLLKNMAQNFSAVQNSINSVRDSVNTLSTNVCSFIPGC